MPRGASPGERRGGRTKGVKNRRTVALGEAAQSVVAKLSEAMIKPFEGDAHLLLVMTYKDTTLPLATRLDAAAKALPYEKPRLQAVAVTGKDGGPLEVATTDADLARALAAFVARTRVTQEETSSVH